MSVKSYMIRACAYMFVCAYVHFIYIANEQHIMDAVPQAGSMWFRDWYSWASCSWIASALATSSVDLKL